MRHRRGLATILMHGRPDHGCALACLDDGSDDADLEHHL